MNQAQKIELSTIAVSILIFQAPGYLPLMLLPTCVKYSRILMHFPVLLVNDQSLCAQKIDLAMRVVSIVLFQAPGRLPFLFLLSTLEI